MVYIYQKHSLEQIVEREIDKSWVEDTLSNPDDIIEIDENEVHFKKKIIDYNNRYLRVIVNPKKEPITIITLFFDRRLKEK